MADNQEQNVQNLIEMTCNLAFNIANEQHDIELNEDPNYIPASCDNENSDIQMEIENEECDGGNVNGNNRAQSGQKWKARNSLNMDLKIRAVDYYRSINRNACKASRDSINALGKHVKRQYFTRSERSYNDYVAMRSDRNFNCFKFRMCFYKYFIKQIQLNHQNL